MKSLKVDQLIIENKVLECERNVALKEAEVWKQKCKELELRGLQLEEGRLSCGVKDGTLIGTREGTENGGGVHASKDLGSPSRFTAERREEIQVQGTPCISTRQKRYLLNDSQTARLKQGIHAKKHLVFANERSCDKKIAPSTPAGARPSSVVTIDIVDSDEERDIPVKNGPPFHGKRTRCVDLAMDEEGTSCSKGNVPFVATPKRKRDPKVFTSDDECEDHETMPKRRVFKIENNENEDEFDDNITPVPDVVNRGENDSKCHDDDDDDDDNLPISQLKRNRAQGSIQEPAGLQMGSSSGPRGDKLTGTLTRPRRRLVKSEQGKERGRAQEPERSPENRTTENDGNDTSDENESESDGGSLSSFIVDSSDVEDDVSEEDGVDDIDELEYASDSNLDFGEIISRLQSRKIPNSKWDLEGDMLSAFGKDPELCMRAVCALYRQQTTTEKLYKESIIHNRRGFSKFDAPRGTKLGEFLNGGDPNGDLVRSVEELQEYDPGGLESCCSIAKHYSKQLFEIYKNNEDPFFPPS